MDALKQALDEVVFEMGRACVSFPPMLLMHEAEAVIREEMDDLTEAIRQEYKSGMDWPTPRARKEAIQLGAMVLRFLTRM